MGSRIVESTSIIEYLCVEWYDTLLTSGLQITRDDLNAKVLATHKYIPDGAIYKYLPL